MSGLLGWHLLIILAVLALIALAVFGIYWVVRLAARHGTAEAQRRSDGGVTPGQAR